MIDIRLEEPRDIPRIYRVNQLAFGQTSEANLVNALRNSNALTLSMVRGIVKYRPEFNAV